MTEIISVYKIEDPKIELHKDVSIEVLKELADSIKEQGQEQSILVRKRGDHYQVIDGHNRLKAARMFGIDTLRAEIVEKNDADMLLASAVSNIQRTPNNILQEAALCKELKEEHKLSVKDIAKKFGKSEGYVRSRIRMLDASPLIQQLVVESRLHPSDVIQLLKIEIEQDRDFVAADLAMSPHTVSQANFLVEQFIRAKEILKDAPKEQILEEAKTTPRSKCEFCKDMVEIHKLQQKPICDDCEVRVMYLLTKDKEGEKK